MQSESSELDDKQRSLLLEFYLSALGFAGALVLMEYSPSALARNTARRNDRHRWLCRVGFASFP